MKQSKATRRFNRELERTVRRISKLSADSIEEIPDALHEEADRIWNMIDSIADDESLEESIPALQETAHRLRSLSRKARCAGLWMTPGSEEEEDEAAEIAGDLIETIITDQGRLADIVERRRATWECRG